MQLLLSVSSAYAGLMEASSTVVGYSDDQVVTLARRRVILDPSLACCVLCGALEESALHLFLRCHFANKVWYDIFPWLVWQLPLPPDLFFISYRLFVLLVGVKKGEGGLSLIWHSVTWSLWEMRNGCIFLAKPLGLGFHRIKSLSCQWFLARSRGPCCLYYEWHVAPVLCLGQK